jgi:hypothetical protein
VQEVEEECSAVNRASPPGQRHIQCPELTARRLAALSSSDPSVLKATVLFWSGKQIWPLRKPSIATIMAPPPPHDQRYSADWAAARSGSADAQKGPPNAIQREQQRLVDYYKEETRLRAPPSRGRRGPCRKAVVGLKWFPRVYPTGARDGRWLDLATFMAEPVTGSAAPLSAPRVAGPFERRGRGGQLGRSRGPGASRGPASVNFPADPS